MTRRTVAAAVAATVAAAGLTACGGSDGDDIFSDETAAAVDRRQSERQQEIRRLVREGRLPPIALELLEADGGIEESFIDGPNGGEDVVRTRAGGTEGPKLEWDLDGDGKITAPERELTERDIYNATVGIYPTE